MQVFDGAFFWQAFGLARSRYIVVILKEMWPGVVEAAEILLYLCGCCRRVAPAGDLGLVDAVARGELQFFMPGVDMKCGRLFLIG